MRNLAKQSLFPDYKVIKTPQFFLRFVFNIIHFLEKNTLVIVRVYQECIQEDSFFYRNKDISDCRQLILQFVRYKLTIHQKCNEQLVLHNQLPTVEDRTSRKSLKLCSVNLPVIPRMGSYFSLSGFLCFILTNLHHSSETNRK